MCVFLASLRSNSRTINCATLNVQLDDICSCKKLGNQYHNQVTSVTSECFSVAPFVVSPFPPTLAPGNHCSALCYLHFGLLSLHTVLSWSLQAVHAPAVCPFLAVNVSHSRDVPQCFSVHQLNAIFIVPSVWLLIMLL